MPRHKYSTIEGQIGTCVESALHAVRTRDVELLVTAVRLALEVYETYPRAAQERDNRLPDLLAFTGSAAEMCDAQGRSTEDVLDLQARAEALRRPLQ